MKWLFLYGMLALASPSIASETEYLPHAGATVDYQENTVTFDDGNTKSFEAPKDKAKDHIWNVIWFLVGGGVIGYGGGVLLGRYHNRINK